MNSMSDQISELSDEDQERFHEYTQRSLRRQWMKAEERTEREQDQKDRRRPQ